MEQNIELIIFIWFIYFLKHYFNCFIHNIHKQSETVRAMLGFVYVFCFDLEQDVIISVIFLQQTSQPLGSETLALFTCKAQ